MPIMTDSLFHVFTSSCSVQLQSGIAPVASLVNIVGGVETDVAGGCMFALANRTNITSLKDIVDVKVLCIFPYQKAGANSTIACSWACISQ